MVHSKEDTLREYKKCELKTMRDSAKGAKMKKYYYLLLHPFGRIRRYFLKMASFGQVLVPPSKTWIFQRDFFLRSINPTLAVDIGGNLGQWATEARKITQARIITFEPDPRCYSTLMEKSKLDLNWEIVQKAAGKRNSEQNLSLMNVDHGYSSLKNMTSFGINFSKEAVEEFSTSKVIVERLDSYFDSRILRNEVVWLKIDVQGFELEVLEGSEGILEYIDAVEIEISMLDLYENTPHISTIFKFFEDRNFVLCSTFSERWTNTGVADFDALFIQSSLAKKIIG